MGWLGRLCLHYRRDGERTTAVDRHEGPMRVLQALYPEGPGVCHHVLVHPPGGIVGGDTLRIEARLDAQTHALVTTPGAARFYRSAGAPAEQTVLLDVAEGARLEWLPLETIAYSGCHVRNHVGFNLHADAQMIGWDVLALGLPATGQAFDDGLFEQHLEWPGVWLERGRIGAGDRRLLDSPLGLAGHRVLATMWFASGRVLDPAMSTALLEAARSLAQASPLSATCGATALNERVVVVRLLAHRTEPAMQLWQHIRAAWREVAWERAPCAPRIWST
jgi:urease accessory protein